MARQAGDGAMGNYEAMDQRLALQWSLYGGRLLGTDLLPENRLLGSVRIWVCKLKQLKQLTNLTRICQN